MIKSLFHVNINVKDFDRSMAFYQMLGFKQVVNAGDGHVPQYDEAFRIPNNHGRAALLRLGDDPQCTYVDLIEWKTPLTEGEPYPNLYHAGIARIALLTTDIHRVYEDLKAKGIQFFSEPKTLQIERGSPRRFFGDRVSFVCFTDPDGTVIELIDFPNA
jgi:glyoxylase I family protein